MASTRTFFRTVIQVEVLSQEPYDPHKELEEIAADITTGEQNGDVVVNISNEKVDAPFAAQILLNSGSDPSWFGLDDDGNDLPDRTREA